MQRARGLPWGAEGTRSMQTSGEMAAELSGSGAVKGRFRTKDWLSLLNATIAGSKGFIDIEAPQKWLVDMNPHRILMSTKGSASEIHAQIGTDGFPPGFLSFHPYGTAA